MYLIDLAFPTKLIGWIVLSGLSLSDCWPAIAMKMPKDKFVLEAYVKLYTKNVVDLFFKNYLLRQMY